MLGRLTFATNAADIWSALHEETARQRRGVCRSRWPSSLTRDVTAPFGPLSAEEAVVRNEAAAGTRFGTCVR